MAMAFVVLLLLLLVCSLCGCTKKVTDTQIEYRYKEVPVEVHDTFTRYSFFRDTTYVRDSVMVVLNGDTVYRYKWHVEYRDRYLKDTVNKLVEVPITLMDTTYIDKYRNVVEEKTVYKQHWWQKILSWAGAAALIAGIIALIILFVKGKIKLPGNLTQK